MAHATRAVVVTCSLSAVQTLLLSTAELAAQLPVRKIHEVLRVVAQAHLMFGRVHVDAAAPQRHELGIIA